MTTQELLNAVGEKHNTLRNSHQWRYTAHFKLVQTHYIKHGWISQSDKEFLEHILHTDRDSLRDYAYCWGKWYCVKPRNVKIHNLASKKTIIKAMFGRY